MPFHLLVGEELSSQLHQPPADVSEPARTVAAKIVTRPENPNNPRSDVGSLDFLRLLLGPLLCHGHLPHRRDDRLAYGGSSRRRPGRRALHPGRILVGKVRDSNAPRCDPDLRLVGGCLTHSTNLPWRLSGSNRLRQRLQGAPASLAVVPKVRRHATGPRSAG
jgi:hypothetical protein